MDIALSTGNTYDFAPVRMSLQVAIKLAEIEDDKVSPLRRLSVLGELIKKSLAAYGPEKAEAILDEIDGNSPTEVAAITAAMFSAAIVESGAKVAANPPGAVPRVGTQPGGS